MKPYDFDLNKPPRDDNNVSEAGPSNPMFRFELGCMPPGHPSPRPIEAKGLDAFDVVGFHNYDKASVRFFKDFNSEPQGGPSTRLVVGCQPVEPSIRPQRSPSSMPSDLQELYINDDAEDDNNGDNHDNVVVNGDNYDISSTTIFDHWLERGPINPMAQVGQQAVHHVHVAPVEQSLQPQGSQPHGPVDVVDLVSDDEHVDNHEDEGDDEDEDSEDNNSNNDDDGYNDDDDGDGNNDDDEEEDDDSEDDDVVAGDDVAISTPIDPGQASSSRTAQGRTSLINSESRAVEPSIRPLRSPPSRLRCVVQKMYDDDDSDDNNEDNLDGDDVYVDGDNYGISSPTNLDLELERGPTNPMAQVGQQAVHHVHVAPVEQSLRSQPRGPVDVVDLVSDDDLVDNHEDEGDDENDDSEDDNNNDDNGDGYNDNDEEEDDDSEDDDSNDVVDGDDVAMSTPIDPGQASSSRTAQRRTSLISSEPLQISDNHQRNVRRRVESQPRFRIRNINAYLREIRSSMPEPVAPTPLPPSAPTSNCPTCTKPPEASSSTPKPVAPLLQEPPHLPALECPICMGPLVDEMTTKCGHVFCEDCIKAAFAVEAKCPICRFKLTFRELTRIYLPVGN